MVELSTGDPLLDFVPESKPTQPARPSASSTAEVPGRARPMGTVARVRRASPATLIIAALVLLSLLQGGIILWWLQSEGRGASEAVVSAVTITSDPEGSPVTLNGAVVGTTPLATELEAGTHTVQVGDEPPRRFAVHAGAGATVHVVLSSEDEAAATTGSIQVTTDPPGAAVSIGGVSRGVSPVVVADLAPGLHQVTISHAGTTVQRSVTVDAGSPAALAVSMAGGGIPSGWLTVTSPVPAQIFANGTLIGRTDTPRTLLPTGRYELVLVNEALNYRAERTVQIAAGRTASVRLEPVNGSLNINAQPWATVLVDGSEVGETPIGNLSLPIGAHEVVLRHPQFGERRQTVMVGVGPAARLGVDLRR